MIPFVFKIKIYQQLFIQFKYIKFHKIKSSRWYFIQSYFVQAQQLIQQDINVEEVLKGLSLVQGATQYLVLNSEGIPIKKSPSITAERALHIAFLIQDYWLTVKKVINNDLRMHDNALKNIRIRTAKQQQIILIQSFTGDATLYLVQNCAKKQPQVLQEKKQIKE